MDLARLHNDLDGWRMSRTKIPTLIKAIEQQTWLSKALGVCSIPLTLSRPLMEALLKDFAGTLEVDQLLSTLKTLGLLVERNQHNWRLDQEVRRYFLEKLETDDPAFARKVHAAVLRHLEESTPAEADNDQMKLAKAFHTIPSDKIRGFDMYWTIYCQLRVHSQHESLTSTGSCWLGCSRNGWRIIVNT